MPDPETLARETLDMICEAMPQSLQAARAPVEARRHLLGLTKDLPETKRQAAFVALEALLENRFGPQGAPAPQTVRPSVDPAPPDEAAVWMRIEMAIGDAFATTFDGSGHQADAIARRARAEALRVIENGAGHLGFWAKRRLKKRIPSQIAEERARLLA